MRRLFFVLVLMSTLFILACSQQEEIKVSGNILGLENGEVVLLDENREEIARVQGAGDS